MNQHKPLIIDIAGTKLTTLDCERLKSPYVGGVIYFQRNWENPEQLCELSASIKAIRQDIVICIDHEGGRVQRFQGHGLTMIPGMGSIEQVVHASSSPALTAMTQCISAVSTEVALSPQYLAQCLAHACGIVAGYELRAIGVDWVLAPVLDINYGRCPVIDGRSFGDTPHDVVELATHYIKGLACSAISNCGKHFPGHGYTNTDTHYGKAVDARLVQEIQSEDMSVFSTLMKESLHAIMPSHVIYAQADKLPAGFSPFWLKQMIRERLNYQGVVVSDDLGMAAAGEVNGQKLTQAKASCLALNAGCDVVLVCNLSIRPAGEITLAADPRIIPTWDYEHQSSCLDQVLAEFEYLNTTQQLKPNAISDERRRRLLPQTPSLSWQNLRQSDEYVPAKKLVDAFNSQNSSN